MEMDLIFWQLYPSFLSLAGSMISCLFLPISLSHCLVYRASWQTFRKVRGNVFPSAGAGKYLPARDPFRLLAGNKSIQCS